MGWWWLAGLNFSDTKDCQLVMDIAIKCGDISNATKTFDLCKRWAGLIMEEFFRQVCESKLLYPSSFQLNRET